MLSHCYSSNSAESKGEQAAGDTGDRHGVVTVVMQPRRPHSVIGGDRDKGLNMIFQQTLKGFYHDLIHKSWCRGQNIQIFHVRSAAHRTPNEFLGGIQMYLLFFFIFKSERAFCVASAATFVINPSVFRSTLSFIKYSLRGG